MLHKISELCDRIDVIKKKSDKLRQLKYNTPKQLRHEDEIKSLKEDIQYMCRLIGADRQPYEKK